MSTVLGSKTDDAYMQMSSFGGLLIEVTPTVKPHTYMLDVGAANRREALHMELQPNETVDQFCGRLKGMLRALWQGERMPERPEDKEKVVSGKDKLTGKK